MEGDSPSLEAESQHWIKLERWEKAETNVSWWMLMLSDWTVISSYKTRLKNSKRPEAGSYNVMVINH